QITEAKPELEYLPMNAPEAGQQIVSGIYSVENGKSRWMSGTAVVLLKSPIRPEPIDVSLYLPPQAPARHVRVSVDEHIVAEQTYTAPGAYTITTPPVKPVANTATITITADKTFSVPGDQRVLGVVLIGVGFKRDTVIR